MQLSPVMVGSMLSNQLLEAGRQVVGQTAACCGPNPGGPGRFFKKTWIIAFHDLMSYPLLDSSPSAVSICGFARASPAS